MGKSALLAAWLARREAACDMVRAPSGSSTRLHR
jgi:hypothetical protein